MRSKERMSFTLRQTRGQVCRTLEKGKEVEVKAGNRQTTLRKVGTARAKASQREGKEEEKEEKLAQTKEREANIKLQLLALTQGRPLLLLV
mmetsp:Transcript_13248/g.20099  ORF Transcript_13248/g.20099 Transcript_13248/m.20099 type:complete len:91 (+) Transcript_13248:558-830(+)